MHTQETLSFLAGLLGSPDPYEQGRAVYGMSSFANGCPPQTPDNVKSLDYLVFKDPAPYRTKETVANFAFGGDDVAGNSPGSKRLASFLLDWWNAHPELH